MYRGLCRNEIFGSLHLCHGIFCNFYRTLLMGFLDGTCCSSRKASHRYSGYENGARGARYPLGELEVIFEDTHNFSDGFLIFPQEDLEL